MHYLQPARPDCMKICFYLWILWCIYTQLLSRVMGILLKIWCWAYFIALFITIHIFFISFSVHFNNTFFFTLFAKWIVWEEIPFHFQLWQLIINLMTNFTWDNPLVSNHCNLKRPHKSVTNYFVIFCIKIPQNPLLSIESIPMAWCCEKL